MAKESWFLKIVSLLKKGGIMLEKKLGGKMKEVKYLIKNGTYPRISLRDFNKKGSWRFRIHQIVAWTFLGILPDGFEINHKDGKRIFPGLDNLEYVTHAGNMQHAKRTGLNWTKEWVQTMRRKNSGEKCVLYGKGGETHHAAKVSDLDVVKIRRLNYIKNYSVSRLSEIFGVSKGCIQHILMGHTHNPERLTRGGLKERYSHGIA